MPTYSFTRTREQLRDKILRKLGALATGETAKPDDAAVVYEAIDLRLKELHKLGVLWHQVAGAASDVALTAGVATANAPADCLFPVTVSLRIGTEDKQLELIDHRSYQAIANKQDAGEPEAVFFSGGVLRFWPVPQSNSTAKLTYEAIAADTAANTAPDIDSAMLRAFAVIVASDLADDFAVSDAKALRLAQESEGAIKTIRALNPARVDAGATEADYF